MERTPTFIGTIEDVEGFQVRVLIDQGTSLGLTFVEGYGYRVGQVSSFVRIPRGYDAALDSDPHAVLGFNRAVRKEKM
jgi:hypothetical protein